MFRSFFMILIVVLPVNRLAGCTNFLITKGASADGSTMITYAADSHVLYGELYYWPSKDYKQGDSLEIYEWDTGKFLGKIRQVKHTYKVVGNMNENQVAIGETTFTGREGLQDTLGIIDYGSLMYIALQRARTAREAITIMTDLVTEYGYYSTGESFSISDPDEVWIMDMIGKGVGNKGAVWVARKIPDGYISGHANQARITTFPLNDIENCMYSEDVISFAIEKGYFKGRKKDFSFADAYNPLNFEGARFCESRVWSAFRRVNDEMGQYEDYAMGLNLENRMPLWVRPDRKLTVKDVMELMRDYFQDTQMDMTLDVGAGPYGSIIRWRPLTWELDGKTYFNERATSTQQTGFSFVAQARGWLPGPIGGILWFGVDDTYSTVYTPMFCGISEIPVNFREGNGSMMEFSDSSAFWIFNQVSNFAYTRYNHIIPEIRQRQSELEENYIKAVVHIDSLTSSVYSSNPAQATNIVTRFSSDAGANTFSEWKTLYAYLFTKYMDGNIKTFVKGQLLPELEQPGYGDEWYRRIVNETGDKFLIRGDTSH